MTSENINSNSSPNDFNFAIRFGLGAIKAVGLKMMENAVDERKKNGKFSDIYDFCSRLDPKAINKKSIEALAKSGTFDSISKNRQQIAESFDTLSAYAHQLNEAKTSNQMSLFGSATQSIPKPILKSLQPWNNIEILQKEFESFGFFLNQHPLDENISNLKKRGVIFSNYVDNEELEDNSIVKMAGVILSSKHRSSARGRFAYINISDPFGIYEVTIFDEALITNSRDLLQDGSVIVIECLIRKDVGGSRIMIKAVSRLTDFIANIKPSENDFADIKKIKIRKNNFEKNNLNNNNKPNNSSNYKSAQIPSKSASNHPTPSTQNSQNIESNQKKIKSLFLTINNKSIIDPLKIILNQKISSEDDEQKTQIVLIAKDKSKSTKIALPLIYKIREIDVIRFKNFNQNLAVEVEYL